MKWNYETKDSIYASHHHRRQFQQHYDYQTQYYQINHIHQ